MILRAGLNLLDKWKLATVEVQVLLGAVDDQTLQRWKDGEISPLPDDLLFRLNELLGIHKALRFLFRDVTRGFKWMKRPDKTFGGMSALDLMLRGSA